MSQEERDELHWLKKAKEGAITQREAAEKMGISDRWVRKLLKRMAKRGDGIVVHGLRGRRSNRQLPAKIQRQALAILKQPEWHDFGPTFGGERRPKIVPLRLFENCQRLPLDLGRKLAIRPTAPQSVHHYPITSFRHAL